MFTKEAIKKGACALVVEKDIEPVDGITVVKVPGASKPDILFSLDT